VITKLSKVEATEALQDLEISEIDPKKEVKPTPR